MSDYEGSAATLERPEDIEKNPAGVVKRWLLEIKLADKREGAWKKKANKVWDRYRQKDAKRNSFNILWSNTETLRPAVYNSLPKPDVRRRFKDADPMGKAVAEVLSRSLEYGLDTTDFDAHIKATVLDMLLPGRGVARVRYVPTLSQVGVTEETHTEENEQHQAGGEALEGETEELQWEQAPVEHVQWDDFRCGPGKEWGEVPWISFDHRLTRDELVAQFGDKGEQVSLDNTDDEDVKALAESSIQNAFKTALVHEIWCKESRSVYFVAPGYKDGPLLEVADPLNLQDFWPIPRPLYAVEDSASLVPTPLYELYREQAEELDAVSARINRIIKGLKLRGIYDSTVGELNELMRAEDNDFVPAAQSAAALIERQGLNNAIWTTSELVKAGAIVLKELYTQRDACKQVIYEIIGLGDILRGVSNPNETARAQEIKSKWGGSRIAKLQMEVARFIRDLMRLQGEIIAEKFQPETLAGMTGLNYPTAEQKQMALAQAQQTGQQPPQMPPSWDEIIQVLRDDKQRTFKVDIETDSTVAAAIETDMDALQKLLGGIVQLVQGFGPAVQMGAIPIEAVKELILAVTRRAKLGNAVEDALDKIQQPPPPQNPDDGKAQAEQAKIQQEGQLEQMRLAMEERSRQAELQAEMRFRAMQEQMIAEREERQNEREAILRHQELMQEQAFERFKALLEAKTKVEVAEISAGATLDAAQIAAANQGTEDAK